jgi:uncharacterized protein
MSGSIPTQVSAQKSQHEVHGAPAGEAPLFVHPGLKVRRCEWGWGVFTDEPIAKDTLLEECHYLLIPWASIASSPLGDYVFQSREAAPGTQATTDPVAVVLGYGMIYNHSSEANATYYQGGSRNLFTFYATRAIAPGEQICINYGETWWQLRGQSTP